MIRELRLFVFGPFAMMAVTLYLACGRSEPRSIAERRHPAHDTSSIARTPPGLGTAIEGVYTNAHTVRSVDGIDASVDDVLEIALYDQTHVFFRISTHFDIGHSCSLYGIATLEDRAFIYRTKGLVDNEQPCTLKIEATPDELRITDRLESNGASTCREFCGVRGNLSEFAIGRTHRRAMLDTASVKNSTEFAEAVAEFNSKESSR